MKTQQQLESRRASRRKWAEKNPEAMNLCRERWRLNNHDRILQKRRERVERLTGKKVTPYRRPSPEEIRFNACKRNRRWYQAHKHEIKAKGTKRKYRAKYTPMREVSLEVRAARLQRQKKWRSSNRDKMRVYDLRSREKIQRVLKQRLSSRISSVFRRRKHRKNGRTIELVGCTWVFLKAHIENLFLPGMSWENRRLWHLDHIRPCAKFDLRDKDQQRACFHFTNLQPLWAEDNMKKWAHYAA